MFYTYNLQRFRRDWYLWRSDDCLNTTISFDIRCGFKGNQKLFYQNNQELFLREDELDKREEVKIGY
uniref:DUF7808 domain-containing protein n=1 Tax=Syphacia muris TaxID=451379 RepID=A0A0N5AK72_9BILA